MITADVIVDLQYGDCGKGKVAHALLRRGTYTHTLRFNGGCNAGHTIIHEGRKFVTHHLPAGVFFGVKSIIGPGCVLDPEQFFKEIEDLRAGGINTDGRIFVARNTHIITQEHKEEDAKNDKVGTTKRGNGPAYRDKHMRSGIRAEEVKELQPFLIDMYGELHTGGRIKVLCEGAQGFGLDIDWGDYPYVTSSMCTVAGAIQNGIPTQAVRCVWGVLKAYETYVGKKEFQPTDPIFNEIGRIGEEIGSTTGRIRQCNWLNLDLLDKAVKINGVTHVVISKWDVLRRVGMWKIIIDGRIVEFRSEDEMKRLLTKGLEFLGIPKENIYFSEHKDRI